MLGSKYSPPAPGSRALDSTTGTLTLTAGNLDSALDRTFTNTPNNIITITPTNQSVKLTVTAKTGLLKGSFKHPNNTNALKPIIGVILQQQKLGGGYFIGTNATGSMLLEGD